MATMRLESDSIGTLEVPADAYYGVQSLRGSMNFRITGYRIHDKQIKMLAALKKPAPTPTTALASWTGKSVTPLSRPATKSWPASSTTSLL